MIDHATERIGPHLAGVRGYALPFEQEAQIVTRRDRLDLGTKTIDRIAMDTGEQAPLAPFAVGPTRREMPRERKPFRFERDKRSLDRLGLEAKGCREHREGHGPLSFETSPHELDQRCVQAPSLERRWPGRRSVAPSRRPARRL